MNTDKCQIWGTQAQVSTIFTDNQPFHVVDSPRAGGRYLIGVTTPNRLPDDEHVKARLTTWLVEQRRLGNASPIVTKEIIKEAQHWRPLAVHERADRALKFLRDRSHAIGKRIQVDPLYDSMLPATESIEKGEVAFLLEDLMEKKWINGVPNHIGTFVVSIDGYSRLEELEKASVNSSQAFVAMWFDASMSKAYNKGIALGVEDAGYKPIRIDRKDHNNKIDDEIIAEIRRSRFLVADFTQGDAGTRGGVYYEAGFAHGLNIPVIFTCREDVIDKVHFDTRQYNHIKWKTPDELRSRLAQRISATIGDGPLRKTG
jgi:nucleoside 2-deoxyribosyltransferase